MTPVPDMSAAAKAAFAPLVTERATLEVQFKDITGKLAAVNAAWRLAEGKALAAANLDPGAYGVDSTGTKFIPTHHFGA